MVTLRLLMAQVMVLRYAGRSFALVASSSQRRSLASFPVAAAAAWDDEHLPIDVPTSIPYPKSLSPSSIIEFQKCPQSFLFQYLWGLKQPTTPTLAKGTMCHAALEQIFDLEPNDRTLENLQNLYRKEWSRQRKVEPYNGLFRDGTSTTPGDWNVDAEREWGLSGLHLLENYVNLEDPRQVLRPNPVQREVWVKANLDTSFKVQKRGGDQSVSYEAAARAGNENSANDTFLVRGIVDRLDMIRHPVDKQVCLRLVDYKSGKAPQLKYSASMNAKIAEESFYQLKIYALLLRESQAKSAAVEKPSTGALQLRILRLLHLTSSENHNPNDAATEGPAQYLDYDLGATQDERNVILDDIYENLVDTWTNIRALVDTQDPLQFRGCDRSFCWCHKCRPQFVPGSLWEP
jgi:RecB family exonuclease